MDMGCWHCANDSEGECAVHSPSNKWWFLILEDEYPEWVDDSNEEVREDE